MDDILPQQLLALGQDTRLRKQNILNLVPCLTQQEVRDLTARLSVVDFRTDIVGRLPPELRLNIAGQFGDVDVSNLLNVSRHWRAIWLQPDILRILSQQCCYLDDDILNDEADGQSLADWTTLQYELVCKRRRRFLGRFSSALVVRHNIGDGHQWLTKGLDLDGVFPEGPVAGFDVGDVFSRDQAPPLQHCVVQSSLYAAGRLAWLPDSLPAPDNTLIVVENLNTRTKRIYRNASVSQYGRDMTLKALGDKLLVAGTSRVMYGYSYSNERFPGSDFVHRFIWHLDSNKCSQVFLPQQPTCCVTRGEYVAFLRPDGALLWNSGSELRALDFKPVLERHDKIAKLCPNRASHMTKGAFFHPFEEGTLYITVCFTHLRHITVHKFTPAGYSGAHGWSLCSTKDLSRLNSTGLPDDFVPGGATDCKAIRPLNSSGDFLVGEWTTIPIGEPFNHGYTPGQVRVSGTVSAEVRFNVKTGAFSLGEKSLPSGSWSDMSTLDLGMSPLLPTWNHQMAFVLQATQNRRILGGAGSEQRACWDLALVVMPTCQSPLTLTGCQIHSRRPLTNEHAQSVLSSAPCSNTVEDHVRDHNLDLSPARSLTLITEEDRAYRLKPESHSFNANTELLRSLYSKSSFILDLTPPSSFSENDGPTDGPHHIFQDDDFIILFHRHGYIAWDFRTARPSVRA